MHAVPVKPSFVPKLNRADVLVAIGLDLERSWLPALLEVASKTKILPGHPGHIDTSIGVPVAEVPKTFTARKGTCIPREILTTTWIPSTAGLWRATLPRDSRVTFPSIKRCSIQI